MLCRFDDEWIGQSENTGKHVANTGKHFLGHSLCKEKRKIMRKQNSLNISVSSPVSGSGGGVCLCTTFNCYENIFLNYSKLNCDYSEYSFLFHNLKLIL